MEIIPAIDLMNGKVVRLLKGDPTTRKIYEHLGDPVTVAQRWESEGARYLHVIDLDAALGLGNNTATIGDIVNAVEIPVQVGGGIRNIDVAENYLNMGVDRIILGSLAFKDPSQVREIIKGYGSKHVVIALDNLRGQVVVKGWKAPTRFNVDEAISMFSPLGIKFFLVTSVARDGTLKGPDFSTLNELCNLQKVHIIAAGGISSLQDLISLKKIGVYGVVIGKALYEGKIQLRDALKVIRE